MERVEKNISTHEFFPVVKEMLAEGHAVVFKITGSSMLPFLGGKRDSVRLASCDVHHLKPGDLILFQRALPAGDYVLHRVHKVYEDSYLPMGDGNLVTDAVIKPEQVIGKVTEVERKGKWISCDSFGWRFCTALWRGLTPIRPWLLTGYRGFAKIKSICCLKGQ